LLLGLVELGLDHFRTWRERENGLTLTLTLKSILAGLVQKRTSREWFLGLGFELGLGLGC